MKHFTTSLFLTCSVLLSYPPFANSNPTKEVVQGWLSDSNCAKARASGGLYTATNADCAKECVAKGKKIVLIAFNEKAVAREVHVLAQRADGSMVDGLVGGERVITVAPATLKDGDKIKIKGQS